MKLTRGSSYALHAVAHLGRQKNGDPVASHHIAAGRGIPERFLLKVLRALVSAGVLASVKGPGGGYKFRKPLGDVSLLDVVEAVDGPIGGGSPFNAEGSAAMNARLEVVCRAGTEAVRDLLKGVRVSDLVAGEKGGPPKGKAAGGRRGRGAPPAGAAGR